MDKVMGYLLSKMRFRMLLLALAVLPAQALALEASLVGLFKNQAAFMLDGKHVLLKQGQTHKSGIKLIKVGKAEALIEYQGQRQKVQMNRRISTSFSVASRAEVSINKDRTGSYVTRAHINGRSTEILVDTGATAVALSSVAAKRLGLRYQQGEKTQVTTASGVAAAYRLNLPRVSLGSLTVHQVRAVVIEGSYPTIPLLGMSFLNQVNMNEKDNILYLKAK